MACPRSTSTTSNRSRPSWKLPQETDSPVIMQASAGARKYAGESLPAPPHRRRRRSLPAHPGGHAPGPRPVPAICMGAIRSGFVGDDGRLAAGRRQDPVLLRIQRRRCHPPRGRNVPRHRRQRRRRAGAAWAPRNRPGWRGRRRRRRRRARSLPDADRPDQAADFVRQTNVDALWPSPSAPATAPTSSPASPPATSSPSSASRPSTPRIPNTTW